MGQGWKPRVSVWQMRGLNIFQVPGELVQALLGVTKMSFRDDHHFQVHSECS